MKHAILKPMSFLSMMTFTVATLSAGLASTNAHAATFTLTNEDSSLATTGIEGVLRTELFNTAQSLATSVNTSLPSTSQDDLLKTMANANAIAGKGQNLDNGEVPKSFSLGVVAGAGFNSNLTSAFQATSSNSLPAAGVGLQGGVTLGVNARLLGFKSDRLFIGGQFFTFSPSFGSLSASLLNLGLSGQYALVPSVGSTFLAKWGGIYLGTGVNYTTNTATFTSTYNFSSAGTETAMSWAPTFNLGISTKLVTIPIDVMTSATLLSFLTIYGGIGGDFNFGSSAFTGTATGPVTATTTNTSITTSNLYSATGTLDFAGGTSQSPTAFTFRTVAGASVNIIALKFFGQFQWASSSVMALTGGVRFTL